MDNEEAKNIFAKYFPNDVNHPMLNMILGMKIDAVADMDKDKYSEKIMYMLNKELIEIKRN